MFEDRSKTGYDFNKFDNQARVKVITEEKKENKQQSLAHQMLFGEVKKQSTEEVKQEVKATILKQNKAEEQIENMPSSAYLKTFENKTIDEFEVKEEQAEQTKEINFEKLLEETNGIAIEKSVTKEIQNVVPKPKKNYSFRIKLVTGVYCILVALFGGWVISNTINISNTNASLYETTIQTTEINNNILDIISDIKQLDNASSDPEDETIVVKIITEEINIKPEAITNPNNYQKSSNWFDVICNWISGLFGG